MIRLLNICVIAALVMAASYVYKIKFESTKQAERVAKLRMEIRREQDTIAALRAEWSKLDSPPRIQMLAQRHLTLKPVEARQFDRLNALPERPAPLVPPDVTDPIAFLVENPDLGELSTATIPAQRAKTAAMPAPTQRPKR